MLADSNQSSSSEHGQRVLSFSENQSKDNLWRCGTRCIMHSHSLCPHQREGGSGTDKLATDMLINNTKWLNLQNRIDTSECRRQQGSIRWSHIFCMKRPTRVARSRPRSTSKCVWSSQMSIVFYGGGENGLREVVSRLNGLSELNQVTSDGDKEACDIHE